MGLLVMVVEVWTTVVRLAMHIKFLLRVMVEVSLLSTTMLLNANDSALERELRLLTQRVYCEFIKSKQWYELVSLEVNVCFHRQ